MQSSQISLFTLWLGQALAELLCVVASPQRDAVSNKDYARMVMHGHSYLFLIKSVHTWVVGLSAYQLSTEARTEPNRRLIPGYVL
jgi:hypothetical protein